MFAIQKMIESRLSQMFAVCLLLLCLALGAAATPANPAAQADDLPLPLISSVDPEDILLPKPPPLEIPPPCQVTTAMEQKA